MQIPEIAVKNWEFFFGFWDNCICIGCVKHSVLLREYFSSGIDMLTNSLEISDTTKS